MKDGRHRTHGRGQFVSWEWHVGTVTSVVVGGSFYVLWEIGWGVPWLAEAEPPFLFMLFGYSSISIASVFMQSTYVSGFGWQDAGVLELDTIPQAYAVFRHQHNTTPDVLDIVIVKDFVLPVHLTVPCTQFTSLACRDRNHVSNILSESIRQLRFHANRLDGIPSLPWRQTPGESRGKRQVCRGDSGICYEASTSCRPTSPFTPWYSWWNTRWRGSDKSQRIPVWKPWSTASRGR
jgi:hypothetical protein